MAGLRKSEAESAAGEGRDGGCLVFPPVETYHLAAPAIGQVFRITIMPPAQRRGQSESFPVVFATDANMMFDALRAASYGLPNRFLLVGIGYPSDMPFAGAWLRARDMSFPGYPDLGLSFPDIEGVLNSAPGAPSFYGGRLFRDFLVDVLMPFVDERFPVLKGDRTYFGHSLGAGFGLYCLLSRSALFQRLVLSSPGLAYHGTTPGGTRYENYDFAIRMIEEFAASGEELPRTRLYMSAGGEENGESGLEAWRIVSSLKRTASVLERADIPGLEFSWEIFPGEHHGTAWLHAFTRGMRTVLSPDHFN